MPRTRIGLELSAAQLTSAEIRELAALADESDIETLWVAEGGRDAVALLGSLSQSTRRVRLASGPIDVWTRTPYLVAMAAATLQELSDGRFTLGLSPAQTKAVEMQHGIDLVDLDDAPSRMREFVLILSELFQGRATSYQGRFLRSREARLPLDGLLDVPILLNARQGEMLDLAGARTDGAILSIATPRWIEQFAIPHIREGAESEGRHLEEFRIAYHPILCLSEDDHEAIAAAQQALRGYWNNQEVIGLLRDFGHSDEVDEMEDMRRRDQPLLAPERLVREIALVGRWGSVMDRIGEYEAVGVTEMIFRPYPPAGASAYETVKDVISRLARAAVGGG